ncbi:hypothetical protein [Chromobacterium violaceum]|uniref:hypothetical protein n=1 Tax=Chromobacterium violaceum TaxID=536 RepID=UPI001C8BB0EB|nr:hypothetical protein [Chromobacterium violaceum]MBX9268542.1 hypothetical protein [Chromobacterium violaceum]
MNAERRKLVEVVAEFVTSLTSEDTQVLSRLVLNHQVEESWPWCANVLSKYLEGDGSFALIKEIDELFPDESALKLIEAASDDPIFEAKVILREAQKLVRV